MDSYRVILENLGAIVVSGIVSTIVVLLITGKTFQKPEPPRPPAAHQTPPPRCLNGLFPLLGPLPADPHRGALLSGRRDLPPHAAAAAAPRAADFRRRDRLAALRGTRLRALSGGDRACSTSPSGCRSWRWDTSSTNSWNACAEACCPWASPRSSGCVAGVLSVVYIAMVFGAERQILTSIAPKSVTVPIAVSGLGTAGRQRVGDVGGGFLRGDFRQHLRRMDPAPLRRPRPRGARDSRSEPRPTASGRPGPSKWGPPNWGLEAAWRWP